jgi:hypothetical protein
VTELRGPLQQLHYHEHSRSRENPKTAPCSRRFGHFLHGHSVLRPGSRAALEFNDAMALRMPSFRSLPINERVCLPQLGHFFGKPLGERGFHSAGRRNPVGLIPWVLGQHNRNALRRLHGQSDFPHELLGCFQSTRPTWDR